MRTDIRTEYENGANTSAELRSAGPRSVARIAETLQLIARSEAGHSLAELARRLGVPKASMADILSGLVASGFLFKNPAGRFVLGAGAIAFARMAVSSCSLVDTTHYHLELLVREINETAVIARLDYESMVSVYVDKVESDHSVRYSVPLGLRRELYATSAGKIILAHLPKTEQSAYLRSVSFERFTPRTIVDRKAIERELDEVMRLGFASTEDERSAGASGIAAPVLDSEGQLLCAITVAGPTTRIQPMRNEIIAHVRETARRIGSAFGHVYSA
jgi:IclR family transcriptional regulator, acetate operon repressor